MPGLELGLCLLAMMAAVALSLGLSMLGQALGNHFRADRISRKDERWLHAQGTDPEL